jgi:hypothetical protein
LPDQHLTESDFVVHHQDRGFARFGRHRKLLVAPADDRWTNMQRLYVLADEALT